MQPFFDELMKEPELDEHGKKAVEMLKRVVLNRQLEQDQAVDDFDQIAFNAKLEDYEIRPNYGEGYITIELGVEELQRLCWLAQEGLDA